MNIVCVFLSLIFGRIFIGDKLRMRAYFNISNWISQLEENTQKHKERCEKGGEIVSRGTLWTLTHKRKHDGQYVNLEAEKIAQKIISIEEQDENARILSPQDSLGQVFGSEHNGRVRGIGFGPVPTQVFGQTSYMGSSSSTQTKITRLESELKESDVENARQESENSFAEQNEEQE
ncbi:hypothetical protein ACFE04_003505 [Oxalis oulophora]